eukprot:GILK01013194.1.p1 GENE.GILK01013194.1~~GILK01013194.1.p1  ORF type:complete len:949 (-),score=158.84 GILK01013194.1:122-2920(-)
MDASAVLHALRTHPSRGLSEEEVRHRRYKYGKNSLYRSERMHFIKFFLKELKEPLILMLLVIGLLYSVFGELIDALTIFIVISITVLAEVITEFRAKRMIARLYASDTPTCIVLRDGLLTEVSASAIVIGDILDLKPGYRVPADARLISSFSLEACDTILTGEALPVMKHAAAVSLVECPAEHRYNMVFAGSTIARGSARAVVTATGTHTQLYIVCGLLKPASEVKTPLQKYMKSLAQFLLIVALVASLSVPLLGVIMGNRNWKQLFLTGLSLGFATIPEELPMLATAALALSSYRLSGHNLLIKRLRSAEALGATTVIVCDKTGTLTCNDLQIAQIISPTGSVVNKAALYSPKPLFERFITEPDLLVSVSDLMVDWFLTSDLITQDGNVNQLLDSSCSRVIHPIDRALIKTWNLSSMLAYQPSDQGQPSIQYEIPFDNETKVSVRLITTNGNHSLYFRGSPEHVLKLTSHITIESVTEPMTFSLRQRLTKLLSETAENGLRVLGFGHATVDSAYASQFVSALTHSNLRLDLELNRLTVNFGGFIGFEDPIRPEVRSALNQCRHAGIKVIMLTGDHAATAVSVGRQIGLLSDGCMEGKDMDALSHVEISQTVERTVIFARSNPAQKLHLIEALKDSGEIVTVTGDGINDVPALRAAHVGIAMGQSGVDVVKEVSGMIMLENNFTCLITAIKEGRKLFDNLRKSICFYLACKFALVALFISTTVADLPFPLTPIQIIIMEVFMDIGASVTFLSERSEEDVMKRPPRKATQRFLDARSIIFILMGGVSLYIIVLVIYIQVIHESSLESAQTATFVAWIVGHLLLAVNMRTQRVPVLIHGLFTNKIMFVWIFSAVAFTVTAIAVPAFHRAFYMRSLSRDLYLKIFALAVGFTCWLELIKLLNHCMNRVRVHREDRQQSYYVRSDVPLMPRSVHTH